MKRYIAENLKEYTARRLSPWHMPGHKRKKGLVKAPEEIPEVISDVTFSLDVTEVPGTDDYHHATGFIRTSQEEAAKVYGAAFSHYLVGGSTAGILAGILALSEMWRSEKPAGEDRTPVFLVGRNSHRSVHHGVRLSGAEEILLTPEEDPDYGPVTPEEVERVLKQNEADKDRIAGAVLTSPTYGGAISDLRRIRKILDEAGIPLMVDEAHGAHFSFIPELSEYSGIACGARIVVQSLHKTLPALTQTGIIHVSEEETDRQVAKFLSVIQSSSPSYILLMSAENAVAWADEQRSRFHQYYQMVKEYRGILEKELKALELVSFPWVQDLTRLYFRAAGGAYPMTVLSRYLEEEQGIVAELAGSREMILISTVADETSDFQKLVEGLKALDDEMLRGTFPEAGNITAETLAVGEITGEDVYVYPPGTLILGKGETVTEEACRRIRRELMAGRRVYGTTKD